MTSRAKEQAPRRVIGYGRVSKMGSRQIDDDSTRTLKIQRQTVEDLCRYRGWQLVGWFQDVNATGGNVDRAQFQQAMALVESRGADVFACAFLDRFSRDVTDTIEQERRLRDADAALVVSDVEIDTSTPTGRLLFTIMAAINQQFLETKTEAFNQTRSDAVARGIAPHKTPLGYRKDEATRRYVVVEDEAVIVREAFRLRADGVPCPEIARQLNAQGYRTRRGAGFTDRLVRNLLAVKSYAGDLVDGDHVLRDAHPAIVGRDVWRKAQTERRPTAKESNPSLLSGTVRCASCSHSMVAAYSGSDEPRYYRCRRVHSSGRCSAPASIRMDVLDAYVEREFLATADRNLGVVSETGDTDAEAAVEAARAALELFVDEADISLLGADLFNRKARELRATLDRAMEVQAMSQRAALPHVGFRRIGDVWDSLAIGERREVLHSTLDAVFVKPAPRSHASADPSTRTWIAQAGTVAVPLPRRGVLSQVAAFPFPDDAVDEVGSLAA